MPSTQCKRGKNNLYNDSTRTTSNVGLVFAVCKFTTVAYRDFGVVNFVFTFSFISLVFCGYWLVGFVVFFPWCVYIRSLFDATFG